MLSTVRVARQYTSARSGALVDALPADRWQRLLDRLDSLDGVEWAHYASDTERGVRVVTRSQRGVNGAYAIHSLACDHGAIAVVEY